MQGEPAAHDTPLALPRSLKLQEKKLHLREHVFECNACSCDRVQFFCAHREAGSEGTIEQRGIGFAKVVKFAKMMKIVIAGLH